MTFEYWWDKYCLTCAGMDKDAHERMWECAQQVEREACASLAASTICDTHVPTGINIYGDRVAKAIRARGNK